MSEREKKGDIAKPQNEMGVSHDKAHRIRPEELIRDGIKSILMHAVCWESTNVIIQLDICMRPDPLT